MDAQEERPENFSVNDAVVWKKNKLNSELNEKLRLYFGEGPFEKFGEGPFVVLSVLPVPLNMCSCGAPFGYCRHSDKRMTEIEVSGHHQRLSIAKNGEPIKDNRGINALISGCWFKKQ
ncbi:hypothetical protein A2468_04145 [Candidatus Falkowbacteria bacterium RIFOXYC2_FULL_46_15]|uniref:Uncharacterized protein n=1 Tax=Candidatus Falkowbacteria bacterium RIFOXYA2_FULL_47_19 TaxID=1797994 RepID=A0A1F5SP43_9BACT|nr:MAG: hypothetical protein A2227_05295 [Candidatus Falkowbacteria bacterium RIFOXYA2_FULL_47_19]OGF35146.1 MAG: hypothetical protein A2468_04145 [Candidatus Falkowbacteria bacterium RIFOXYC2_FULL_46_15]